MPLERDPPRPAHVPQRDDVVSRRRQVPIEHQVLVMEVA